MSLPINDTAKKHLFKLIEFIFDEVDSSSGDGDAIWYTKYYNIKDLYNLFIEINNLKKFKWTLTWHDEHSFSLSIDQASILVTSSKNDFDARPIWQQLSIVL